MLKLALKTSNWIKLDTWEADQVEWIRTANVLKHHQTEVNKRHGCVRLMLLCGADLLESFSVPGLWSKEHVRSKRKTVRFQFGYPNLKSIFLFQDDRHNKQLWTGMYQSERIEC
jgi:nicotinic acid mononucleotide adenylyltransferase